MTTTATKATTTKTTTTPLLAIYPPLILTELILVPFWKIFSWFVKMDTSAPSPDCISLSIQTSPLLRVTSASLSSISLAHFSVNTLRARGLISTENALLKRIQKTVMSVLVHIAVVSLSWLMTLNALAVISFVYVSCLEFQVCLIFLLYCSFFQTICSCFSINIIFVFFYILEQGRRNNLNKKSW